MSLDAVEFHARRRPQAIAIVDAQGAQYTYVEVHRHIVLLAQRLRRDWPQLQQLQPIAVSHRNKRLHLYLIFALEALGLTSMPFVQPIDPGFENALGLCRLVIAEESTPLVKVPHFIVTPAWFEAIFAEPVVGSFSSFYWQPELVPVMLTTSGSTGAAKTIPLHRRAFAVRERSRLTQYGFSAESVFLVALPPSVFSIGLSIRCVFRCGGRIVFWDMHDPVASLAIATHTTMLPMHLRLLLDTIPASYAPSHLLRVMSVGAPLAAVLRADIGARLNARVQNLYGSNELGGALLINADDVSDVYPGVELEVIDAHGQLLPRGVPGIIRARSPGMALRYIDDLQTRERFVDGWFITGDTGVMHGYRQLQLLGRSDSMLNLGGTKIAPERIEDNLMALAFCDDLAVCSIADRDRIDRLYVGIVGARCDEAAMISKLTEALGVNFGAVHLVYLNCIARNQAGKVLRAELLREIRSVVAQSRASAR